MLHPLSPVAPVLAGFGVGTFVCSVFPVSPLWLIERSLCRPSGETQRPTVGNQLLGSGRTSTVPVGKRVAREHGGWEQRCNRRGNCWTCSGSRASPIAAGIIQKNLSLNLKHAISVDKRTHALETMRIAGLEGHLTHSRRLHCAAAGMVVDTQSRQRDKIDPSSLENAKYAKYS